MTTNTDAGPSVSREAVDANPYLQGLYAPVTEEITATDLPVTGTLPAELDGRYLRIGPNPIDANPATYHWFTGSGMVHGVRLRDGRAEWYRNRWVRDANTAAALGEADRGGPHHNDNGDTSVNTHVIGVNGRTFALVEAGSYPIELDDELETIGRNNFDGTLRGSFSAHTKIHAPTGHLHAVTYYWPEESVHHIVLDEQARVVRDVEVPVGGRPMVHDLALSDTRVALFDLPVQFDLDVAMAGRSFPYIWAEDRPARVGLLPIDGGPDDVVWCDVDPCYVYHPANAVDLPDGRFQFDVVRHASTFRTTTQGPFEGPPTLVRWTADPATGTVREDVLDDAAVEFPRFDERRSGRDYRYVYLPEIMSPEPIGKRRGGLRRVDVTNASAERWDAGPGRTLGEFVFVPRESSSADGEDRADGWLVGLVHDATTERAELAVLAADDIEAGPVATVHLPAAVPLGFHGSWIPS